MTELTNAQLHQIREALRVSVDYLPDSDDLAMVIAARNMVTGLLEVPAKVEPQEKPAAKAKKAPKAKPELTVGQESALNVAYLNEKRHTYLDRDIRRDVFLKLRENGYVEGYHSSHSGIRLSEKALRYLGLDDVQVAKHRIAYLSPMLKYRITNLSEMRYGSKEERMEALSHNIDELNRIGAEVTLWEIRAGIAK